MENAELKTAYVLYDKSQDAYVAFDGNHYFWVWQLCCAFFHVSESNALEDMEDALCTGIFKTLEVKKVQVV